ncbi:unnamed protein product [Dibothriocephalus latus]|uniref:RRM domain-containing protein n=1 Tax=Dibothriocephalus latus TaxID=60516 RepID=A0A3P7N4Z3_DIBLA|nr:unnamed protein product [Dibothriocephalus latus]
MTEVFVVKKTKECTSARCGFVVFHDTDAAMNMFDAQPHMFNGTKITVSVAKNRNSKDQDKRPHTKPNILNGEASTSRSGGTTIFVGRLTPTTTEGDLAVYFSEFGTVKNATVVSDRTTGLSRGFGFVTFVDRKAFENGVLEACHLINGYRLNVKPARPQTTCRPARNVATEDIQSSTESA